MRRSVVTECCRQVDTEPSHPFYGDTLLCSVRALAVIPALGLTLLVGCGGAKKQPDVRAEIAAKARTCADGAFLRLGSSRSAYAAVVRSRATVYRSPGSRAFASFRRLNANPART